jgi:Kdo2-lipid IVA lauroyltransferase/acyltransferase
MFSYFIGLIARIPLPIAHRLGAALGWAAYALSPRYRRRLRENLTSSAIALTAKELKNLTSASVSESGKAMLELPFVWSRPTTELLAKVQAVDGWDSVVAARAEGKGVIMLTPHLGCFELIGRYLAAQFPITILFRPPKLSWIEPILRAGRQWDHAELATTDARGVRALLRALKRGHALGILPDQAPGAGEGVWAEFFHRSAYTMTLIQRLQQRTRAPIIVMYAERLSEDNGFKLHFRRISNILAEDSEVAAREINAAMEQLIEECPSQYLWSYNRYKVPSGASAPAKTAAVNG